MPPKDVLLDIIEEEVFHTRDYFLRNPVISVLFRSRIRKLNQLSDIRKFYFSESPPLLDKRETITPRLNSFLDLFKRLEKELSIVKVEMSSNLNPSDVAILAEKMVLIQNIYEANYLKLYLETYSIDDRCEIVKAADHIPSGLTIRMLEESNEEEKLLLMLRKEYARIKLLIPK